MKLMYMMNPQNCACRGSAVEISSREVAGFGVPSWFGRASRPLERMSGWVPPLDVAEDADNLMVQVELPGMRKEDIDLSLHEGVLTITGERRAESGTDEKRYYLNERFSGQFRRSVMLPKAVKAEATAATYENGVLTITLPKTDAAKPRRIKVSAD